MKAGLSASSAKIKNGDSFDPLLGYQGSLVADISLSSRISIQPALRFVTKGFSSEGEFRDSPGSLTGIDRGTFRTNYLEVPLLVLYKTNISESCKIFGGLGPYMAAGINGKSDFGGGLSTQNIKFGPKANRPEGTYNRRLGLTAGYWFGKGN